MNLKKIYIGLRYNSRNDKAPKIHFKYYGYLSENILRLWEKNNIPIIKDDILMKTLKELHVGEEIPEELYLLIANIYKMLYKNGYLKEDF
ncbi:MAG: EscU/YscU/HrcU family type III secretion system export apparatus switch protein [Leptonema sp. (in: bacteria)]